MDVLTIYTYLRIHFRLKRSCLNHAVRLQGLATMQVQGRYEIRGGAAHLILQPVMPAPGEDMELKPPTATAILEMIRSGDLVVHPTKANLTKSQVSVHMCNIQRELRFSVGAANDWNQVAWDRLKAWLMCQKRDPWENGTSKIVDFWNRYRNL